MHKNGDKSFFCPMDKKMVSTHIEYCIGKCLNLCTIFSALLFTWYLTLMPYHTVIYIVCPKCAQGALNSFRYMPEWRPHVWQRSLYQRWLLLQRLQLVRNSIGLLYRRWNWCGWDCNRFCYCRADRCWMFWNGGFLLQANDV